MAYPLSFLLSSDAAKGRDARRSQYLDGMGDLSDLSYVLHVEKTEGFVEMDAEDRGHADALAHNILNTWADVRSIALRAVKLSGRLSNPLRIYDFRDVEVEDATG